jgi:hypothetical protein
VATRRKATWWRDACLAATGLGSLVAYSTACVTLLHFAPSYVLAQNLFAPQHLAKPSAAFLATFLAAIAGFRRWPRRLMNLFDPQRICVIAPGARILLAMLGFILCGLGSYTELRPVSGHASALSRGSRTPQSTEKALTVSTGLNIVLISLDTVRADHVSAYGYPKVVTPNLDDLAKEGVLFEQAIAPSSWTLPALWRQP